MNRFEREFIIVTGKTDNKVRVCKDGIIAYEAARESDYKEGLRTFIVVPSATILAKETPEEIDMMLSQKETYDG